MNPVNNIAKIGMVMAAHALAMAPWEGSSQATTDTHLFTGWRSAEAGTTRLKDVHVQYLTVIPHLPAMEFGIHGEKPEWLGSSDRM